MRRYSRKIVILLLAAAVLALDVRGFAQQSGGSPDGLYAVPDGNQSAQDDQNSPSRREAENYLKSLDPQCPHSKSALESTAASGGNLEGAGIKSEPARSAAGPDKSERAWTWFALSAGFLVSLSAVGIFWSIRSRQRKAIAAALIALEREPSGAHAAAASSPDQTAPRRAA